MYSYLLHDKYTFLYTETQEKKRNRLSIKCYFPSRLWQRNVSFTDRFALNILMLISISTSIAWFASHQLTFIHSLLHIDNRHPYFNIFFLNEKVFNFLSNITTDIIRYYYSLCNIYAAASHAIFSEQLPLKKTFTKNRNYR